MALVKSKICTFFGLLILLSSTLLFPSGCKSNENGNNAIGEIAATPIAADGMLYFGTKDGNLYALDEHTGKIIWTFNAEGQSRTVSHRSIRERSSLVTISDRLYALKAGTRRTPVDKKSLSMALFNTHLYQEAVLIGTVWILVLMVI